MNPFLRQPRERPPIRAELPQPRGDGSVSLRLYDPIDSWGGPWGVSAKEFAAVLDELPENTSEIRLLINSPGGEVWEGLAILNQLRAHPARVVAVVEGIAASAASFIAAAADELVMMDNAEIFVHRAWGMALGNAEDMTKLAADLSHADRNIASIYAAKAGGEVDDWVGVMSAETWYSAAEAVESGLADRVAEPSKSGGGANAAKAKFDLTVFAHPDSRPAEPANPPLQKGSDGMSDTLISGLRDRLGIRAEAELDEDGLLAAVDEALAEHADSTPAALPEGVVAVDRATLDQLRADAQMGREARTEQIAARREETVQAAVRDGRIPPARADHWRAQLTADPGAEQVLNDLPKGLVALAPLGYVGGVQESSDDDVYAALYPEEVH